MDRSQHAEILSATELSARHEVRPDIIIEGHGPDTPTVPSGRSKHTSKLSDKRYSVVGRRAICFNFEVETRELSHGRRHPSELNTLLHF